jgi:hypothetical protein
MQVDKHATELNHAGELLSSVVRDRFYTVPLLLTNEIFLHREVIHSRRLCM